LARLRALWTDWSLEVRVLLGSYERPCKCRVFLLLRQYPLDPIGKRENANENVRRPPTAL